ncbi:MAG: XRE family transcriptional regulator [Bacteroidetes bacterium]|nr:MAG: XRE family transcriptional regulator [Bacteroidota bacterium]
MSKNNNNKKEKRVAPDLLQKVAHAVIFYRMKRKLTKEKLEYETGLNIARYESGRHDMTLTTLSILSKHLDVEPYKLLK